MTEDGTISAMCSVLRGSLTVSRGGSGGATLAASAGPAEASVD